MHFRTAGFDEGGNFPLGWRMRETATPGGAGILRARASGTIGVAVVLCLLAGPSAAAVVTASEQDLGKRMALVIGNGAYGELGTLPNPTNDASDLAEALRKLHFDVTLVLDGHVDEMQRRLREFGRDAAGADVALFFYAGHGMAIDGQNYLVPVGAHIENNLDVRFETLGLSDVRESLEFTGAKLKMVILDACRDNPLQKVLERNEAQLGRGLSVGEGLAQMDVQRASGMFIAYATAPGNVALDGSKQRNSPFTRALLDHIDTPNTDVRVMFGQVRADVLAATNSFQTPWVEEAMLGAFEFNPTPEPPPDDDFVAWKSIASNPDPDPADLQAFIDRYPQSSLVGAAQSRLDYLRDPARQAEAWKKLAGSTEVDAYEKFLHRYPDGLYAGAAQLTLQGLLWGQLAGTSDLAGMEAFVSRFPNAPLAPVAEARIAQLRANPPAAPAAQAEVAPAPPPTAVAPAPEMQVAAAPPVVEDRAISLVTAPEPAAMTVIDPPPTPPAITLVAPAGPARPDLTPEATARLDQVVQLHMIQAALGFLGFYDGEFDGKSGPKTLRAISEFQDSIGAVPTGRLQPPQIVQLVAKAAEAGDPFSENTLGMMLASGAGVDQDPAAAALWFQRSADGRFGVGQYNLGISYLNGIGVPRDPDKARLLLESALAKGVREAQAALDGLN